MAETRQHRFAIRSISQPLEWRYRNSPDISVDANMLVYFKQGDETQSVAPDVMVVFGVEDKFRRTYWVEREGKVPAFVAEVSSTTSKKRDRVDKLAKYDGMGVQEYLLFDPRYEDEGHDGSLQLYKRIGEEGQEKQLVPSGPGEAAGSTEELHSDVLGVTFRAKGKLVRMTDSLTGKILTTFEKSQELRVLDAERRRSAELERDVQVERRQSAERERDLQAERRRSAERERDNAVKAQRAQRARIARLEAMLRAIRGDPNSGSQG